MSSLKWMLDVFPEVTDFSKPLVEMQIINFDLFSDNPLHNFYIINLFVPILNLNLYQIISNFFVGMKEIFTAHFLKFPASRDIKSKKLW